MKTQDSDARTGEGTLIPQASLTRIEGLPSGHYARKDWGQEREVKARQNGSRPTWRPPKSVLLQILLVGVTNLAIVGVSSRRMVIQETVFGITNPNPLPYITNKSKYKYQDVCAGIEYLGRLFIKETPCRID